MGLYLQPADVTPFTDVDTARIDILIEDAEVFATLAAPPLADPAPLTETQRAQVKTILRRAVIREADAGTGAKTQEVAGPYSYTVDTRKANDVSFLTEEEEDALRGVVGIVKSTQAFNTDVTPAPGYSDHLPWCDLMFGGLTCSCGVSLTGYFPLYEMGDAGDIL